MHGRPARHDAAKMRIECAVGQPTCCCLRVVMLLQTRILLSHFPQWAVVLKKSALVPQAASLYCWWWPFGLTCSNWTALCCAPYCNLHAMSVNENATFAVLTRDSARLIRAPRVANRWSLIFSVFRFYWCISSLFKLKWKRVDPVIFFKVWVVFYFVWYCLFRRCNTVWK